MSQPWKKAIVVGASSGIGKAIAERLLASGVNTALVARRSSELEKISAAAKAKNPDVLAPTFSHDVHNYAEAEQLFDAIAKQLGGLDVIFYASGVMPKVEEDEYDFAKDREMIEVNVLGAFAWLNEAAKRFERVKAGTIVGISSIAGDRGRRGNPAYCTSKAALTTYLESLRNRLGRYGVNVVTIKPGFIDTDMTRGKPGLFWLISAEDAAEEIIRVARAGKAEAYVPARWGFVSFVLRRIPSFLFKRLSV